MAVQGALAVLALGAAWATWQRPAARPDAEVVVVDVEPARLERVRYEAADGWWVELSRDAEGGVLATLSAREAVSAAGAGPGARPSDGRALAALEPARPERTLRGSEAAEALLGRLAPLRAARSLGVLGPEGLASVGLDAPGGRLSLVAAGRTHAFSVSTAVVGASSPYARREGDGQAFLLASGLLADLEAASSRLVERRLHRFRPGEFDGLTVTREGGARRELLQKVVSGGAAPGPALFPRESPERADERLSLWHDQLWRSAPVELYGRGERPEGLAAEPRVEVRLDYAREGKPLGFLELARDGRGGVLARSELTAGWASLPATAAPLLDEGVRVAAPTP